MGEVAAGRVADLCKGGGYEEVFGRAGSVYLCARARLDGRPFMAIAVDPEPTAEPPDLAGSLKSVLKSLALAEEQGWPVVFLFDAPRPVPLSEDRLPGRGRRAVDGPRRGGAPLL